MDEAEQQQRSFRWQVFNDFVGNGKTPGGMATPGLTRSAQVAWFALFRHADSKNEATVSLTTIAKQAGMTTKTASEAIYQLRRAKLILRTEKGTQGGRNSTYVIFPKPEPRLPDVEDQPETENPSISADPDGQNNADASSEKTTTVL